MVKTNYTPPPPAIQAGALAQALEHAARGWLVHPCKPDKTPLTKWKDEATTDPEKIKTWWENWPDALIGVFCQKSGFFAVDIDVRDGRDGWRSLTELQEQDGQGANIPVGPIQNTPSGGAHLLFKSPSDLDIPNNANKLAPGLDLRWRGYICTGAGYTWLPDHGPEVQLTDAPDWLLEKVRALKVQPKGKLEDQERLDPAPDAGAYWLRYYLARATVGNRNDLGFALACQLRDSGLSRNEAESIMLDYASMVPGDGYSDREAQASLQSAYQAGQREPAHLPGLAMNSEKQHFHKSTGGNGSKPSGGLPTTTPTPGAYKLDDIGNGERLAARHGHKLRYVKEWGWLVWNGQLWEQDRGQVAAWAKETARSIYAEAAACEDESIAAAIGKHARSSASKSRRDAMIDTAISEPGIQAAPADFDLSPWLINVQNGILDLQTGELRAHDPQAQLTKIAGAAYDPAARCPTWQRFLDRVFEGNQELIAFVQRAVGYSLTGNTGEQCLFFLYGHGANGKSTFTGAIQDLLGDYAMKTRAETLMVKRNETIPEEVAQIAGVRFLLASELGEGERLNEGLVKDLTGGDRLRGRLLYRKSFEFIPLAKAWLYGNHKPMIRGTDEGIWRRVRLVPFAVTIPEAERDGDLPLKLRDELPGILNWALAGCQAWQKKGLQAPALVRAATAAYRAEQDILATFLEDYCIISDLASVTAGELYQAYKSWAAESGLNPMSKIAFSRQLAERGHTTNGRDGNGRAVYRGVGLLADKEVPGL